MIDPARMLPHQKPAVIISRIESMDAETCLVHMEAMGPAASPFLLIEAAAQSVAAMLGQDAANRGTAPALGFLVGVRNLQFSGAWRSDEPGRVTVKQARNLDPFFQFDAMVEQRGEDVAQGTITLFKKES